MSRPISFRDLRTSGSATFTLIRLTAGQRECTSERRITYRPDSLQGAGSLGVSENRVKERGNRPLQFPETGAVVSVTASGRILQRLCQRCLSSRLPLEYTLNGHSLGTLPHFSEGGASSCNNLTTPIRSCCSRLREQAPLSFRNLSFYS